MGRITEQYDRLKSWSSNNIHIYDELSKNYEEGDSRDLTSKKELSVYTLDTIIPDNKQFVKLKTTTNQYGEGLPPFKKTNYELAIKDDSSGTGYKKRNIYLCQGDSYGYCSTVFVLDMNTLTLKELKFFEILPKFNNNGIWDDDIFYLMQYMNCSSLRLDDYLEWGDSTYDIWFEFFAKLISREPEFSKFSHRFFSDIEAKKILKAVRVLKLK